MSWLDSDFATNTTAPVPGSVDTPALTDPVAGVRGTASALDSKAPINKRHNGGKAVDITRTNTPSFVDLIETARRYAMTDRIILIRGETGTGKTSLVEAMHLWSGCSGPMIVCDCSTLHVETAESELFGHRKGAFTGATSDRQGLFEAAKGGTLFLDEIGDMPLDLQAKLLRALQNRVVRPLGTSKEVPITARVICATHRDLRAMVAAGTFRRDLYYRIAQLSFAMPAVRERRADIPLLVEGVEGLSAEVVAALASADVAWPGNIREVQDLAHQAAIDGLTAADVMEVLGVETQAEEDPKRAEMTPAERELVVLELARRESGVTSREIVQALGVHNVTASRIASRLVLRGKLKKRAHGCFVSAKLTLISANMMGVKP